MEDELDSERMLDFMAAVSAGELLVPQLLCSQEDSIRGLLASLEIF